MISWCRAPCKTRLNWLRKRSWETRRGRNVFNAKRGQIKATDRDSPVRRRGSLKLSSSKTKSSLPLTRRLSVRQAPASITIWEGQVVNMNQWAWWAATANSREWTIRHLSLRVRWLILTSTRTPMKSPLLNNRYWMHSMQVLFPNQNKNIQIQLSRTYRCLKTSLTNKKSITN